ncbi:beta-galactosidase [Microbacterium aurantiacum]|uniref:Beta-galactosidase n=2 Tax=Microbacterium aurantiacum TaxID=162393 RepID=A0A0M8MG94_9MICO|nr:beta-galactosidase [Microbacterium chocolatum]KOS11866.1 beta-galactosidase [Microbacterium chocolatum]
MGNDIDVRPGLKVTSAALLRDGRPWLPVSGELHYTRVPRARWAERIRLMRAGGIDVVSTYAPWIHHQPEPGPADFHGELDIAAFVDTVRAEGLELVLRIGPWAHGELRNGGFPDWVQALPVRHRTDDPAYLTVVREWFGALGAALDGRAHPENVLGIQLDNELYDQPDHLATLKRLARDAGLSAPLWTATAWGSAQLPEGEVVPVWGGYGDGFWVDPDQPWDDTFRAHFFFSDRWDDPGIGADLRAAEVAAASSASELFPRATCEVGGGMATAYHRRPRPAAPDIAAVAHAKLGSGSAWQGFYMYAGGANPTFGTAENQATGYPNDLPDLSYDFHAPIGEAGRVAPSHAALRLQHAVIEAFGSDLATMPTTFPDTVPAGVRDRTTPRWAVRSDGTRGFLFVGWHQPHEPLDDLPGIRFRVETDKRTWEVPDRAVTIPAGTLACWPLGLALGGVEVAWASASLVTVLDGVAEEDAGMRAVPTLVLREDAGIEARAEIDGTVRTLRPGLDPVRVAGTEGALDILVVPARLAADLWVVDAATGRRRLLLSRDELTWDPAGTVSVRTEAPTADVLEYLPEGRRWRRRTWETPVSGCTATVISEQIRAGMTPDAGGYGARDGRHTAPDRTVIDAHAAVHRLHLPAAVGRDATLRIGWAGDVAQLRADGRIVADRFWDASPFVVDLDDLRIGPDTDLQLWLLPLRTDAGIHLPAAAAQRLASAADDGGSALCALDGARVATPGRGVEKDAAGGR